MSIIRHSTFGSVSGDTILVVKGEFKNLSKVPENTPSMIMKCSFEQYLNGMEAYKTSCIQDAFRFLDSTEREFLMTGMDAEEQDRFYGTGE